MLPARPAILLSSDPSAWISCQVIGPNLARAYRSVFGDRANYFSLTPSLTSLDVARLAEEIHRSNPDSLIFLDHLPHPFEMLTSLKCVYGRRPLPPIYFHIYGDFTHFTKRWLALESLLKDCKVHFICASERQKQLLAKFLLSPERLISVCPFPVDGERFHADETSRRRWRTQLGVGDDEFALVYTGRMSMQKNSTRLVRELETFFRASPRSIKVFFAGIFDDLGAPFFGVSYRKGFYFQYWNGIFESLDSAFKKRVQFLGHYDAEQLRGLYNAADAFVSLSLHHDEDFGMSAAESLACGTPVVLSDWGGYASFSYVGSSACQLVPVTIGSSGLSLSSDEFQQSLSKVVGQPLDSGARARLSANALRRCSITSVSGTLRALYENRSYPAPFRGFTWIMQKHAEVVSKQIPFADGPRKDTYYEAIYGSYTRSAYPTEAITH